MSNQYIPDPDSRPSGNGNSYNSRREMRVSNSTGSLPVVSAGRSYTGSFDFEGLIASLRELFARDRQVASQQDSTRCGICYLHYALSELRYREEEGFYVCPNCEKVLGKQSLPMIRRQQKL
ncbi:MAG TPA: hypothetical protein VKV20_19080 [Ktedonobacteraceae bacterium]|nr:hypothetical protein [Ktedonobacteraceae bacterium]